MRPYRILDERAVKTTLNDETLYRIEITEYTKSGTQYFVYTDRNGIKRFSQKTSTSVNDERKMMAHL